MAGTVPMVLVTASCAVIGVKITITKRKQLTSDSFILKEKLPVKKNSQKQQF